MIEIGYHVGIGIDIPVHPDRARILFDSTTHVEYPVGRNPPALKKQAPINLEYRYLRVHGPSRFAFRYPKRRQSRNPDG